MKVKVGDVFMFDPEKMENQKVKNVYDIENGGRPCPVQYVYKVVEVDGDNGNEIVCQATTGTGTKVPANFYMFRDEVEDLVDEASGPLKNLVNKSKKRSKKSKRPKKSKKPKRPKKSKKPKKKKRSMMR